jgi:hypothetical protein
MLVGPLRLQPAEAELSELMERFANVKTLQGQCAVVRNGYLPEREVLTAAGPIAVKVPKVTAVVGLRILAHGGWFVVCWFPTSTIRFSAETSTAFNFPPQLPRTPLSTLALR